MKILIHVPWGIEDGFVGGTERFAINLTKSLVKNGHDAFIVCSSVIPLKKIEGVSVFGVIPHNYQKSINKYGDANELFFKNEIIGPKIDQNSLIRFSTYVSEQIRDFKYDICHLNGFFYSTTINDKKISHKKLLVTMHENPLELDNYWGKGSYSVMCNYVKKNKSFAKFIGLYTQSNYYSDIYTRSFKQIVKKIPLGVDMEYYVYKNNNVYDKNKELIILLPSRFEIKQKGHDIALGTFALLKKRGIKFKAIFTGLDENAYGKNVKYFASLLDTMNLKNIVSLKKFKDMREAYCLADIVISPERFCSYGLSISEALAMGKRTIISPIPTYKEIVSNCNYAYVVSSNTPEYFANKIKEISKLLKYNVNPDDINKFRKGNNFSICTNLYEAVYNKIIN